MLRENNLQGILTEWEGPVRMPLNTNWFSSVAFNTETIFLFNKAAFLNKVNCTDPLSDVFWSIILAEMLLRNKRLLPQPQ